jgi:ATP-dependent Clp protease adaptor protein ClpS
VGNHNDNDQRTDRQGQTQTLTRRRLKRPPLYRVIFHNDDYTTRDFVVMALMRYFHKTHTEAATLMMQIHTQGKGIAGLYPYDIARTKQMQVEAEARQHEMPLKLTIEADDDGQEENE